MESGRRPRPSDIFSTPYQKQEMARMPCSAEGKLGFGGYRRDAYGPVSAGKDDYLFSTPGREDNGSNLREPGSTKTATPSAFGQVRDDVWD